MPRGKAIGENGITVEFIKYVDGYISETCHVFHSMSQKFKGTSQLEKCQHCMNTQVKCIMNEEF